MTGQEKIIAIIGGIALAFFLQFVVVPVLGGICMFFSDAADFYKIHRQKRAEWKAEDEDSEP